MVRSANTILITWQKVFFLADSLLDSNMIFYAAKYVWKKTKHFGNIRVYA